MTHRHYTDKASEGLKISTCNAAAHKSQLSVKPMVFYDGGCGLCQKEISHYARLDRSNRVQWIDIDSNQTLLRALGISLEQAMKRLHVLDCDRVMHTGVSAFRVIWEELPAYRWLARITALPGVTTVLEFGYSRFAVARYARRNKSRVCSVASPNFPLKRGPA